MQQDVTILYQGGSGGFALFYYLLLSGLYQTGLQYQSIHDLINRQFPKSLASNPSMWKQREHWPNNLWCKKTQPSPKLYLICNPCWNDSMLEQNLIVSQGTTKYLLYTDIKTQMRMAWAKKAYWFTDVSKKAFDAPTDNRQYIRSIYKSAIDNLDPMVSCVARLFQPQYKIDLKDFVQTKVIPGQPEPNNDQKKFLDLWINLQPKKSLRYLQ